MSAAEALASGVAALRVKVDASTQQKLLAYIGLIAKWNRVYNLTAVREPEQMVAHHLLDSLAVATYLDGELLADVGSGAGLPGIPLALLWPQTKVTLVESNHKKSAFLKQVAIELGLHNVDIEAGRVEACERQRTFDIVISRAFSDLAQYVAAAGHLVSEDGILAAMKGVYPYEELAQLSPTFRLSQVVQLAVPGLSAERHLVLMRGQTHALQGSQ